MHWHQHKLNRMVTIFTLIYATFVSVIHFINFSRSAKNGKLQGRVQLSFQRNERVYSRTI